MTVHYDAETDSLYIELRPGPSTETEEGREGLLVDLDAEGRVVGLDLDRASTRFDLARIEVIGLPLDASPEEGVHAKEA